MPMAGGNSSCNNKPRTRRQADQGAGQTACTGYGTANDLLRKDVFSTSGWEGDLGSVPVEVSEQECSEGLQ